MVFSNHVEYYAFKATMYEQIANYYKYTHPELYVTYYYKHFEYVQKLTNVLNHTKSPSIQISNSLTESSYIRVLHASPDFPPIDLFIDGIETFKMINYKNATQYAHLSPDHHSLDVYLTEDRSNPIISVILPVEPNVYYTVAAAGKNESLTLLPYIDNTFLPNNESKARFLHLTSELPALDLAVKDGDVVFGNISFSELSDYLPLSPMTVDLEVRISGTKIVVLSLPNLRFEANKIYHLILTGTTEGERSLEAIIIN
ncbi:DUF4397 domain-containing protein [Bacillus sp. RG28]|uniref:DUF4397 domain-containing protein n=1 Tax=Gottfriedia endophytica TaxID=2820819 RepID=A0A940NS29_9BACI|nr:DUF4397 domain-containing protein [Gottfriedia endophytica]MBP0726503.1 DUF4397 domain-containing protein [Gottfriedia endophytica]